MKPYPKPSSVDSEQRQVFIGGYSSEAEAQCITPVANRQCPNCKQVLNIAAGEKPIAPRHYDLHICFYCRSVLAITDNRYSLATPDDIAEETLAISKIQNIIKQCYKEQANG